LDSIPYSARTISQKKHHHYFPERERVLSVMSGMVMSWLRIVRLQNIWDRLCNNLRDTFLFKNRFSKALDNLSSDDDYRNIRVWEF